MTPESTDLLEAVLRRDRVVVTVILVTVIAVCWLYLLAGAGTGMYPHEQARLVPTTVVDSPAEAGVAMSTIARTPSHALLLFSMWWLMMIAMMLPSAAPMVLLHATVTRKSRAGADTAGMQASSRRWPTATAAFVAGYLVVWGAFSVAAVVAQWALERGGLLTAMMTPTSTVLGAGLLVGAGVWQLTPYKTACLRHCRSPASLVSSHWRPGALGGLGMGVEHGLFCLGCCWALMALLFYGGVMNLTWIIGLALVVLFEKLLPAGVALGRVTGVLLIAWGVGLGLTAF